MENPLKKSLASTKTVGIILAGGKSTIKGQTKPLFQINGRSMLEYAINAHQDAGVKNILVVVNPQNQKNVQASLNGSLGQSVDLVVQTARRGTADAVHAALGHSWAKPAEFCLATLGDMPFWQGVTLEALLAAHVGSGQSGTMAAVWHEACRRIFRHYAQIHFTEDMVPSRVEEYSPNTRRTIHHGGWVSPCLWALTINRLAEELALCPDNPNRDRADLPKEKYISHLVESNFSSGTPFQPYFLMNNPAEAIGINNWRDWEHYTRYHA